MQIKRLVTYFIAAAIIIGLLPAVAMPTRAAISDITGDCIWTLDGTVLTISGNGAMDDGYQPWGEAATEVIIEPGVTHIGDSVFSDCSRMTRIVIPDTVTSIGKYAFSYCSKLTQITIPDGVISIGDYAFEHCSGLTAITIPDSVTSIGTDAFSFCSNLKDVIISRGVTTLSDYMFFQCKNLTNVTIPNSVTSIGDSVFYGCLWMTEITIPDSVTSVGTDVFYGCPYLTAYYPANNPIWTEKVMENCGGKVTWVPYEIEEKDPVAQWNVSLEDDLKVNFYLDGDIAETAEVTVTVGDSVKTCNISELEKDENGRYIVSVNVSAAQMTDEITVQVTDMEPAVYTVRQYCDTILGDESYSQYHQLVKEMLNYGAMAQIYFDHNSENLANNDITGVAAREVPDTTTDLSFDGEADGVEFYGASLVYRDKIAVRYYYDVTEDASSITFTANGNVYTPVLKDGRYYVEVADILPQDLEQQITLTATDNAGNTLTVCYGPMNYIVRMNQKGSESLKALVKALYNYHLAAKALRTETI